MGRSNYYSFGHGRIIGLGLFFWLVSLTTFGQNVKLSDNPEQFLGDLQKLMATGGAGAVRSEQNLETLWTENALSPAQRDRVMAMSRKMLQKRFQVTTHFAPFFDGLYHAVHTHTPALTPAELDNYLSMADKIVEANDPKGFAKAMETARLFLGGQLIYNTTYNRLYLLGGTFTFAYLDSPRAVGNVTPTGTTSGTTTNPASATSNKFDGWDDPLPGDSSMPRPLGRIFIPQRKPIPAVSGPVISFKGASLAIVATGDSVLLENTSGDVLLKEGLVVGNGGKFTWAMDERPDIFVTLSEYTLPTQSPRLFADDVTLTYQNQNGISIKPTKGIFEYASQKRSAGQISTYPRFISWQSDVSIPNLGTDIDYRGGVALYGLQLIGASVSKQLSTLTVKQNGKRVFKASSPRFVFDDSLQIKASVAQFTGYLNGGADSLTHPAIQFRFNRNERTAWLNRVDRTTYGRVPFSDSYHKFYIQPEVVRWDIARQQIDFYQVGAKREVPVRLESFDYFQPQRYSNIATDYGFHPLQIAANYISTKKTQTFLPEDLAQFAHLRADALDDPMNRMVLEGYVDRDPNSGMMRLSRKGVLYILAYAKQKDYDNFQIQSLFSSNDSTKNATIDLKDNILTVRGVKQFVISDSLKIVGIPRDRIIRIGKGRSFTLNGQLKAGNFRYAGQNMAFDYDKFGMAMNKIDSITFTPQKLAAQGKTGEIGGDIKYDKPGSVFFGSADNKSGRIVGKKTTQRLVMPEGMTVYFNQPNRGDITYNEKVYFKIPAIDNDSLGKGDISFIGTFYSDGIFPPFKTELKTMPDNTLGFVHKPPVVGYPVYGSKSNVKFTGDLVMNKSGLRAEGVVLNHLTASFNTQGMLFMTDSLLASGATGEIREGVVGKPGPTQVYFPKVDIANFSLRWLPKTDSLIVTTQKNNFSFYGGTTQLAGNLLVRATGLFGNGNLQRKDSEAISKSFKFNKEGFLADNSQFKITSDKEAGKPILLGNNIDVDFNQVKGLVTLATNAPKQETFSDAPSSSLEFPFAAYKTSINKAQWNITAKTIAMKGDVKTSTFTATAEDQEGLTFNGAAALYDVEKMTLNISGVPKINSADALIYPDKGVVAIRRNGVMMPFKNARLELDTINLFHKLKNGNIQILSRSRFAGDATYMFPTATGDTASIKMGSFELKEVPVVTADAGARGVAKTTTRRKSNGRGQTSYYTVARAEVEETNNLLIAPRMQFKGNITMEAPDKDLALDGFLKPVLKKRADLISGWIPFKEKIETFQITVDDKLKNEGDQLLVAGIHQRVGSTGLYPTFLSPKEDSKDDDIFRATGVMRYDEKEKVFRIVPKSTDNLEDLEGAFTFNDPKGIMTFKGKLNLLNAAPHEYMLASGSARVNVDSAQYRLNTLLAFTFPIPDALNTAIADKLVKTNLEEKNDDPADDDLNRISDKLLPLIGQKAVDDYRLKAQNQHVSLALASPKLNAMLVLANANLRWSEKTSAFYSTGRLGVSNIEGTDINAQMDGFIEIRKGATGDETSIYLEASPDVWVFYDYKPTPTGPGELAIITSEQELNDRITAGFAADKKTKGPLMEVVPATMDEKNQFVEYYLDQYKTRAKPQPKPAKTVVKGKDAPKVKEKKKDKEDEKEGF